ncbi:MAG: DUF3493 domain-containing protein [Synechococcales cyanobacterium T60_A2020_003]|nr:DUF3493 domain-containing protein [Synechococcales cyanobacterium T60_A2020_003]
MSKPDPKQPFRNPISPRSLTPEERDRLMAEVKAPYRGLRIFVYFACAASGAIGAVIFLSQLVAGRGDPATLPNFALQLGVIALMVWFFRLEQRSKRSKNN